MRWLGRRRRGVRWLGRRGRAGGRCGLYSRSSSSGALAVGAALRARRGRLCNIRHDRRSRRTPAYRPRELRAGFHRPGLPEEDGPPVENVCGRFTVFYRRPCEKFHYTEVREVSFPCGKDSLPHKRGRKITRVSKLRTKTPLVQATVGVTAFGSAFVSSNAQFVLQLNTCQKIPW